MSQLEQIKELVIKGKFKNIKEAVQEALDAGIEARTILNEGLMPGINHVGDLFAKNEVFVPEVLIAARAMNAGVDVLAPLLEGDDQQSVGTAVVGTVKGDLHDIGKNLVALMMRSAGLTVYDLGADVSKEEFVEAVKKYDADIVGLSALLTTTMEEQGRVIEALKESGLRDQVKVMVGGAPVTPAWAEKIGADSYTADAAEAARWAKDAMQSA